MTVPHRPPLVLLHAFPLDARMFDPLRPLLPGITLITPDQRGFGTTDLGAVEPDLAHAADDVIAVLDARGIGRVVVGGVSMGGYVALRLLADHPERLAGLVLADTRSTADTPDAAAARQAKAADADAGRLPSGADLVAPLLGRSVAEPVRRLAATIASDATAAAFAWAQRAMAIRPDSTATLAAAAIPVLVVVGAEDTVTPPIEARALAAVAGRATLVEIAESGHLAADRAAGRVRRRAAGLVSGRVPGVLPNRVSPGV